MTNCRSAATTDSPSASHGFVVSATYFCALAIASASGSAAACSAERPVLSTRNWRIAESPSAFGALSLMAASVSRVVPSASTVSRVSHGPGRRIGFEPVLASTGFWLVSRFQSSVARPIIRSTDERGMRVSVVMSPVQWFRKTGKSTMSPCTPWSPSTAIVPSAAVMLSSLAVASACASGGSASR